MDELTQEILARIAETVLERAAFVFAEPRDEKWTEDGDVWRAEIELSGAICGRLCLASTPAFAAVLASNLLGIDSNDPAAARSAEDALRELSNMICGTVVDHCQAKGLTCSMGTPSLRRMDLAEHQDSCRGVGQIVRLIAENECVDVVLLPQ